MRKDSIKNIKVNSQVMRILSDIIRNDVKDPRVCEFVSLTSVKVAPDLKTCKIYVSVFGGRQELDAAISGLRSAEGYIRSMLAKSANMRITPKLTFLPDESISYGVSMSHKIDEVVERDRAARNAARNGSFEAGPDANGSCDEAPIQKAGVEDEH